MACIVNEPYGRYSNYASLFLPFPLFQAGSRKTPILTGESLFSYHFHVISLRKDMIKGVFITDPRTASQSVLRFVNQIIIHNHTVIRPSPLYNSL